MTQSDFLNFGNIKFTIIPFFMCAFFFFFLTLRNFI